jgi:hypothetical protein
MEGGAERGGGRRVLELLPVIEVEQVARAAEWDFERNKMVSRFRDGKPEGAEEDAVEGTPIPPAAAAALAAVAAVAAVDAGASAAAAACACSLLTGPVVLSSSMSVGYDSLRDSSTCRWA